MPIYLIRHGQSKFNAAFDKAGVDPRIHDARLTEKGLTQARDLRQQVAGLGIRLVIVSPLTRALQTAQQIFGDTLPLTVMAEAREQLSHSCDVGHTPVQLQAAFPQLSFDHLAENWWHTGEPNDQGYTVEPIETHAARVADFARSLLDMMPTPIAVVGHGNTFKAMTGRQMENCEVLRYRPSAMSN